MKPLEARMGLMSNANILLKWKPLGKISLGKVRRLQDNTRCIYIWKVGCVDVRCIVLINPLKPNDPYRGRTAPLTSKRCILYIYSTNIGTEHFKHGIYSLFFPLQNCRLFHNSNVFGSCIIHILYTGCAKIKKIILLPKG